MAAAPVTQAQVWAQSGRGGSWLGRRGLWRSLALPGWGRGLFRTGRPRRPPLGVWGWRAQLAPRTPESQPRAGRGQQAAASGHSRVPPVGGLRPRWPDVRLGGCGRGLVPARAQLIAGAGRGREGRMISPGMVSPDHSAAVTDKCPRFMQALHF